MSYDKASECGELEYYISRKRGEKKKKKKKETTPRARAHTRTCELKTPLINVGEPNHRRWK